jgi:hypothetical protein
VTCSLTASRKRRNRDALDSTRRGRSKWQQAFVIRGSMSEHFAAVLSSFPARLCSDDRTLGRHGYAGTEHSVDVPLHAIRRCAGVLPPCPSRFALSRKLGNRCFLSRLFRSSPVFTVRRPPPSTSRLLIASRSRDFVIGIGQIIWTRTVDF